MAWSTFLHGSSIFLSSCDMTSPNSVRTSLISTLAKDYVHGHIFHHEYRQVLCLFMLDTLLEIDGLISSNTHHTHSRRRAISELLVRRLVCSTFISMPPHPFQEIHAQLAKGSFQYRLLAFVLPGGLAFLLGWYGMLLMDGLRCRYVNNRPSLWYHLSWT